MPSPLLSIQDLCVDFSTDQDVFRALYHISFDVHRGEVVAVVGESGSGKSVTSLSVLQLLPVPAARYASGSILFSSDGITALDILKQTPKAMRSVRGNSIAMIFQEPMTSLNPLYTCGNQVMEAILLHQSVSAETAREKTIALFEKVQLPDPAAVFDRYPHQLSGGQKQRVMIAMAMSCEPSLLIADEPTTALDVTVQQHILRLLKTLQEEQQMGVIFISHDLGLVAEIADRVIVMYKGKIVEQGTTDAIFRRPVHPYTKALLNCRPVLHVKGERLPVVSDFMQEDANGEIIEKTFSLKTFSAVHTPDQNIPTQQPLVKVEALKVWFPKKKKLWGKPDSYIKAVDGVDIEISKGETVGLVGESGCGKTTLGRALLRLIEPMSGNVFFKEKNIINYDAEELRRLRKEMQIIFQDPYSSLNPRMTIGDAIMETMQVHKIGNNNSQRKESVIHILEKVNLRADHFDRYPHEFSGGQRQRIGISRALALDPSFIICDESVSALDVSVQAQVLNLLNDLKKEFGFAALFISHDLSVVQYISDRILVMYKGKIEESGTAEDIYYHPQSAYTKALLSAIPKGIV